MVRITGKEPHSRISRYESEDLGINADMFNLLVSALRPHLDPVEFANALGYMITMPRADREEEELLAIYRAASLPTRERLLETARAQYQYREGRAALPRTERHNGQSGTPTPQP